MLMFYAGWSEIMWPAFSISLPALRQTYVNGQSSLGSLSTLWSLLIFSLMSIVHSGEYMTVSRSSAIVNITYHSPATDSMHSEVRRLCAQLLYHLLHKTILTSIFLFALIILGVNRGLTESVQYRALCCTLVKFLIWQWFKVARFWFGWSLTLGVCRLMNLVAMETLVDCLLSLGLLFTCVRRRKVVLPVVLFHQSVCQLRGG